MSKYINETSCPECDDFIRPYGCINSLCPIRIDYDKGLEELFPDKEERLEDEGY